jgi:hypothetical protein
MRSVIAKKAKFISSKSKDKFVYDLPPKLYVIFIVIVGGQHALLSLRGQSTTLSQVCIAVAV